MTAGGAGPGQEGELQAELLEERLGHRFADVALLEQALTHSSAAHESGDASQSNERLELLGDAVLGFLLTETLVRAAPDCGEGVLSRWRATLVSAAHLAGIAERLDLGRFLRLGRGEAASGGRWKRSILADTCEAVIGALYLDGGLPAAARFVSSRWRDAVRHCLREPPGAAQDPKSSLQERLQARGEPPPAYGVLEASGPPHRQRFVVEVRGARGRLGAGEGDSKRQAEQAAARAALRRLDSGDGS